MKFCFWQKASHSGFFLFSPYHAPSQNTITLLMHQVYWQCFLLSSQESLLISFLAIDADPFMFYLFHILLAVNQSILCPKSSILLHLVWREIVHSVFTNHNLIDSLLIFYLCLILCLFFLAVSWSSGILNHRVGSDYLIRLILNIDLVLILSGSWVYYSLKLFI